MKKSMLDEYLRIKQEYEVFKELRKKLGLASSPYLNIRNMHKNLNTSNWGIANGR